MIKLKTPLTVDFRRKFYFDFVDVRGNLEGSNEGRSSVVDLTFLAGGSNYLGMSLLPDEAIALGKALQQKGEEIKKDLLSGM
jgi:hypothetical protein